MISRGYVADLMDWMRGLPVVRCITRNFLNDFKRLAVWNSGQSSAQPLSNEVFLRLDCLIRTLFLVSAVSCSGVYYYNTIFRGRSQPKKEVWPHLFFDYILWGRPGWGIYGPSGIGSVVYYNIFWRRSQPKKAFWMQIYFVYSSFYAKF